MTGVGSIFEESRKCDKNGHVPGVTIGVVSFRVSPKFVEKNV